MLTRRPVEGDWIAMCCVRDLERVSAENPLVADDYDAPYMGPWATRAEAIQTLTDEHDAELAGWMLAHDAHQPDAFVWRAGWRCACGSVLLVA